MAPSLAHEPQGIVALAAPHRRMVAARPWMT